MPSSESRTDPSQTRALMPRAPPYTWSSVTLSTTLEAMLSIGAITLGAAATVEDRIWAIYFRRGLDLLDLLGQQFRKALLQGLTE